MDGINLRAEVTIDLDKNRRVWSQTDAENVPPERVSDVAISLCAASANGANQAYDHAIRRNPDLGKIPEDEKKQSLETFGDET